MKRHLWFTLGCALLLAACGFTNTRPCKVDSDCLDREYCSTDRCRPAGIFGTKRKLPSGPQTNPAGCQSDISCPLGSSCINNLCTEQKLPPQKPADNTCKSEQDCPANQLCQGTRCVDRSSLKELQPYQPFAVKMVSSNREKAFISFASFSGALACGLTNDLTIKPGIAGAQILISGVRVNAQASSRDILSLDSNCPDTPLKWNPEKRSFCAWYRKWDANGKAIGFEMAVNGAAKLYEKPGQVWFQLYFGKGRTFSRGFVEEGSQDNPFCTEKTFEK